MAKKTKNPSAPAPGSSEEHRNPHDFQRSAGPGPKDAGKGAVGREAQERLAGAPEADSGLRRAEGAGEDEDPDGDQDETEAEKEDGDQP